MRYGDVKRKRGHQNKFLEDAFTIHNLFVWFLPHRLAVVQKDRNVCFLCFYALCSGKNKQYGDLLLPIAAADTKQRGSIADEQHTPTTPTRRLVKVRRPFLCCLASTLHSSWRLCCISILQFQGVSCNGALFRSSKVQRCVSRINEK
ncbi:Hypothetical protein, putative [Bodo saltans]|uniref:Uncharacterized protein n=1 Tax=Bodo saltans TaxID=75058 RepID=A0A0S4INP4_BODSA|nr:Hypothetical protein, putative [Bodo saltans]|eukprot:CUE66738.1 Hypothetical protein, putative [Bodo saltans]